MWEMFTKYILSLSVKYDKLRSMTDVITRRGLFENAWKSD